MNSMFFKVFVLAEAVFGFIFFTCLLGISPAAADQSKLTERFCIVPVIDSAPTAADFGQSWRLFSKVFNIPGMPGPVFTPVNRGGQWTIDAQRRFVRYNGPYPRNFLDQGNYVIEPWSDRKISVTQQPNSVSVMPSNATRFEEITITDDQRRARPSGPYVLPRLRVTLVVLRGQAFVVEDRSLRLWPPSQELTAKGISGIYGVYDAPTLRAAVIIDLSGGMHVRSDDGNWALGVGMLDANDYGSIMDLPRADAALFVANYSVTAIRRVGPSQFASEVIVRTNFRAYSKIHRSISLGTALRYASGSWFDSKLRWQYLSSKGWADIEGGDAGIARPDLFPDGFINDLPTIGRTLIFGRDRLLLYDGRVMAPISDSGPDRLGTLPRVHDLPSIGRVLLSTKDQIFEITPEAQLAEHHWPFQFDGTWAIDIVDWPHAGAAAVSTRGSIFVLDKDLKATRVQGADRALSLSLTSEPLGENPGTGELIISGKQGLFLIVDKQNGDAGACSMALGGD